MIVRNQRDQEVILSECMVKDKYYLSPHMLRIVFEASDMYEDAFISAGATIKIILPQPVTGEIIYPHWLKMPTDYVHNHNSLYRTFTLRHLDFEQKEIWIDFVCHGTQGYASGWALKAEKGDRLVVAVKKRKTELIPDRKNFILAADHTGLPFASVILDNLPVDSAGEAVLEIPTEEDILDIIKPDNVKVHWLINSRPGDDIQLAQKVRSLSFFPKESRFSYVAAEYGNVKDLRHYFRKELQWGIGELNALSYWKKGKAETESVQERLAEKKNRI